MSKKFIVVKGANVHNLKNVSVSIPRDKLIVITGVSGSGKSSLAFDTIYAEGQRRYVESLSTYARQFLQMTDKPDVESIEGLSPAISIDQKSSSRNPRSTVGTVTEIYDYLRLLFAKVGHAHCIHCGKTISKQSIAEIITSISKLPIGKKIMLLAPKAIKEKGDQAKLIQSIQQEGFIRIRINNEVKAVTDSIVFTDDGEYNIEIVVDRLVIKDYEPIKTPLKNGDFVEEANPNRTRLADSIELALKQGNGTIIVVDFETGEEIKFSERYACPDHPELIMPEIEPRSFSFNSPHGACSQCHGLGIKLTVQEDLVLPNKELTVGEGIHPWASHSWHLNLLEAVGKKYKFSLNTKIKDLSDKQINVILYGTQEEKFATKFNSQKLHGEFNSKYEGVIPYLERTFLDTASDGSRKQVERYMKTQECPLCKGEKLKQEVLGITVDANNIIAITKMSITECADFFLSLKDKLTYIEQKIAKPIILEVGNRLKFLIDVGLPYLSLNRSASTLSGGEAQRIRLATQIGSALLGVLYVLDEPSIGLHQKDNGQLIKTMQNLRDLGNTVLVVEHDEDTMRAADHIIEIGPMAGQNGGKVIAEGSLNDILNNPHSLTGNFLSGREKIDIPKKRRVSKNYLEIIGANAHNLKNVNVKIPLGILLGISGVSGSGKSTLINGILARELARVLHRSEKEVLSHKEILGMEYVDKIIHIDQSPIGRTPRSNPATYTEVFDDIRDLYAAQPDAKMRGYKSGRFSFNVKGGRCEACKGDGVKKIEMHFLPDVYIPCDVCEGKRYNQEALEIKWRGKSINDVLNMTVKEALDLFISIPSIKTKLQTLADVGLDYIYLGQSATTLSGGEAQRVKLATELSRKATGKTIYILDEPTTGLHFQDIRKLLEVLQILVDKGNSVLLIEHNLDVLKTCDYLIDLGPDGGNGGGKIVAMGTPEEVSKIDKSYTGQFLKKIL